MMNSLTTLKQLNILALKKLLAYIIRNPRKFLDSPQIHKALSNQSGVAALNLTIDLDGEQLKIMPISLNTLKTHSNLILEDGYKGLDSLRIKALEALADARQVTPPVNNRTKTGLLCKIADLEKELQLHKQSNLLLLQALSFATSDFRNIRDASDIGLRTKRSEDATKTLRAIVEMLPILPSSLEKNTTNSVIDMSSYRGKS